MIPNPPPTAGQGLKPAMGLVMGGVGCYATASQVNLVREFLAVFAGNELCLGILFACWFVGIVIGAGIGGRLAHRAGNKLWPLLGVSGLLGFSLPVLLTQLRYLRGVLGVTAGELPGLGELLGSGFALITPFSLLIGLSFPLVCQAAVRGDDTLTIGKVYVVESVGAIAGGLAISVLLAGQVTTYESMVITLLPLLCGLAWVGLGSRQSRACLGLGVAFSAIGLAALALLLSGAVARLDAHTAGGRFDQLQTGTNRVAWTDTPYQHLDLAEREGQFVLFADGKVTATFPDAYRSRPRAHLVMTEHPRPRNILVLGWASMEFLPVALRHLVEQVDLVELDPGVIRLVEPRLDDNTRQALNDRRIHVHPTDGRRFLRESKASWDLIFSDAPDPTTAALNRFFTLEFFELARSRLAPGGVFVTRLSSSATFLGSETATLIRTVQTTLRQAFSQVKVLPGEETFFLASDTKGILLEDPERLGDRYRARGVEDPRFSRHHFKILFQANQVEDLLEQLTRRGQARLNTDAYPLSYLQSILRWSHMTEGGAENLLGFLVSWPAWAWFILVLATGMTAIGLSVLKKRLDPPRTRYLGAVWAIGVVGAVGLALELVLTFSYQSFFGSLYRELGLIVAAFMTGLAAGGVFTNRRLAVHPGGPGLLGAVLLGLSLYAVVIPWLQSPALLNWLPLWVGQALVLLLVLIAGIGTGVVFPLSSHIAVASGHPLARAAGTLDAVDHLGAAAGAWFTGLVLIPTLGRTVSCLLLALLTALAGWLNLLVEGRSKVVYSSSARKRGAR